MKLLIKLWNMFGLIKLLLDHKQYNVNDQAFNPYTREPMSWIEYEELRRQARINLMIKTSKGSLKRINIKDKK